MPRTLRSPQPATVAVPKVVVHDVNVLRPHRNPVTGQRFPNTPLHGAISQIRRDVLRFAINERAVRIDFLSKGCSYAWFEFSLAAVVRRPGYRFGDCHRADQPCRHGRGSADGAALRVAGNPARESEPGHADLSRRLRDLGNGI